MENAEEVMQLLEEFSKIKPKDIPRELDDYLGYVAKTGDPVYQWSLVKSLFREKLISVITDFYESSLTVELPPCPNVEPFNYDRMKTSLLERFDTFSSAPFTVQRICELLTNPRKEYNRADKYMRAIEKNILVVSTREPGSGKRSLECDSQTETVLNGIPDVKLNESDGTLLHVPTDLPYLGAPPASNDVTVETTETTVSERAVLDINVDSKTFKSNNDKPWLTHESSSPAPKPDIEQSNIRPETNTDVSERIEEKGPEEKDCDINVSLPNVDSENVSAERMEAESNSDSFSHNSETVLPDSIGSSQDSDESKPTSTHENDDTENNSDENEVSSTPAEASRPTQIPTIQEAESSEPTDSEAEATDVSIIKENESDINSLNDGGIDNRPSERIIQTEESKLIAISEVTATKSDEVDLECNEISGTSTVVSPISPGNNPNLQIDDVDQTISVQESEESDSHPDSSNDVCIENKGYTLVETPKPELCTEADSMSETNVELERKTDVLEGAPDGTNNEILEENTVQVSSPDLSKISDEECVEKRLEDPILLSNSQDDTIVSEGQCVSQLLEDNKTKLPEVQSTSEIADEMYDQEKREESVIQSVSNISPDSQQQITTIEEISVDPSCEAEEEAMDVDDSSNQMMISEGENEGEPMDQSDQLQS